jgi:Xaa-Pro aminopeptidase
MSGALDGYLFDFCRSRIVGEDLHGAAPLLEKARTVVATVVDRLRPGATVGEAVAAGLALDGAEEDLRAGRFGAMGHGLGLGFEDPWLIPGSEFRIMPGMSIAVETYVHRGELVAGHEEDVIVTTGAPEVLSADGEE